MIQTYSTRGAKASHRILSKPSASVPVTVTAAVECFLIGAP